MRFGVGFFFFDFGCRCGVVAGNMWWDHCRERGLQVGDAQELKVHWLTACE